MTNRDSTPSVPSEIAEFIDFFKKELAGIEFPDVDAEKLDALAVTVHEHADELAELTERVRVARAALEQAQTDLRRHSERGLAYVRVYADGNDALVQSLDGLALARERVESKPPRKRKSKSKAKAKSKAGKSEQPTGELPFEEQSSEAA